MRNKIVEIAIKEIGYEEETGNSNKYSKELYNKSQEWCNDFVCWCAMKAGISAEIIPKYSYVPYTAEWFDKKKLYKDSNSHGGNYFPTTGDIILFDYNKNRTSDHIGIVEKAVGNKIYTIEGNKDNKVKRCLYDSNSRIIRAYCTPEYEKTNITKTVNSKIGLNIREKPTTNSKVIMAIKNNETVELLIHSVSNANGYRWDKIRYNNIVGYVANKYLK